MAKETELNRDSLTKLSAYELHNQETSEISSKGVSTKSEARNMRSNLVEKWLKNIRLYDKVDENPALRGNSKTSGRSTTWEPYATLKSDQQVARLFELFFPNGDTNFDVFTSNYPSLPLDKMRNIIANLENQYGPNLPKSILDKAVKDIAQENADKLAKKMQDILIECNFEDSNKHVTQSASKCGTGILAGPFLKQSKRTISKQDEYGNWIAEEETYLKPYFEYVNIFDWFPDLSAKTVDEQEYNIISRTLSKSTLLDLAKNNPLYYGDIIKEYIKRVPNGNFTYEYWENSLMQNGAENVQTVRTNKYRMDEYWMQVDADIVREVINNNPKAKMKVEDDDILVTVNVCMLDNIVIKCVLNPYDDIPVDFFNLYTRGNQLTGVGLMDLLEEKQRQLNAVVRGKFDNYAEIVIPMRELNTDMFLPQNMPNKLNPGRTLFRMGLGDNANYPAIRQVQTNNVTMDALQLEQAIKRDMDTISSLPGISSGDTDAVGKTAMRTSSGVGQLMGAANGNLRDISKQFDNFLKRVYTRLMKQITIIDDDDAYKGDNQVIPKISTAIIEKTLKSNNLQSFVGTLQPEQRGQVDWRGVTRSQISYMDIDPDTILLSAEDIAKNEEQAKLQQQSMMEQQNQVMQEQKQMEQQKLMIESTKAQGKQAVDMANAQKILNSIEDGKAKGQLDTMLALHKVDQDNESLNMNKTDLTHKIMSDEFDRQERFHSEQMSQNEKK